MNLSNLVTAVLPDETAVCDPDSLPGEADTRRLTGALNGALSTLRLCRLSESQRTRLGRPATLAELRLDGLYARLAQQVPEAMDAIGQPRDHFQRLQGMDLGLLQLDEALILNRRGARTACIVLAADLTRLSDKVDEAADELLRPDSTELSATEKYQLDTQLCVVGEIEHRLLDRTTERTGRRQRDLQRQLQAVRAAAAASEALAKVATLRGNKLPGKGAALQSGKAKKTDKKPASP